MSATNKTTNIELPLFIGTDVPSWLTDWNGAMTTLDTNIATIKSNAETAKSDAANAEESAAQTAQSLITLNNTVTTLQTTINQLTTVNNIGATKSDMMVTVEFNAMYTANKQFATYFVGFTTISGAKTATQIPGTSIYAVPICTIQNNVNPNNFKSGQVYTIGIGTILVSSNIQFLKIIAWISSNSVVIGYQNSSATDSRGTLYMNEKFPYLSSNLSII